ncbi:hypothetical protein LB505_005662 [Fusarium chuoi]|nr:hypothetical protein LB505_005662 [Fusarium chuoi]
MTCRTRLRTTRTVIPLAAASGFPMPKSSRMLKTTLSTHLMYWLSLILRDLHLRHAICYRSVNHPS